MGWDNDYNLGTRLPQGELYTSGLAYVIIPPDVDRDKYIRECYKTKTVSIYSEFNGVTNRVPIDQYSLNFVKFPNDKKEYGSAVKFTVDTVHNRPVIDGIFFKDDEIADLKEHQFSFKRELNGNYVEVSGSPDDKYVGVHVKADTGGEVNIAIRSGNEAGKLTLEVEGDVNVVATGNTILKQFSRLQLKTANKNEATQASVIEQTDEENTFHADRTNIDTGELRINGGEENFVLGQLFKQFLTDFITEVSNATVTTSTGQMPLLNADKIASYKDKIDKFLSQVAFLDS